MSAIWKDPRYLEVEFVEKRRSTSDIAKEHGVFPMTIRRELKRNGIPLRDKGTAQKINIERNGTPTQGRHRTDEEKLRISKGLQTFWDKLTEEEVQDRKDTLASVAKEKWSSMSDKDKAEIIRKMHAANTAKAKDGSKNENAVADMLSSIGYVVEQRTNEYTPGRVFEIDICLPSERVAIEWDGATHFLPIYGEENLAKVMEKDEKKNSILVGSGWTLIRCRDMSTTSSMAFVRRTVENIVRLIEDNKGPGLFIIECF